MKVNVLISIGSKVKIRIAIEKVYHGLNKKKNFLLLVGIQGSLIRTFNPSTKGWSIPIGAPVTAGPVRLCINAKNTLSVKLK